MTAGLQWFWDGGRHEFTLSEADDGSVSSSFPGFSHRFTRGTNIRAVLNGLDRVTNVNVISSPQIMVVDNREAELQVGDEVPIATQSSVSSTDSDAPTVNTIQFRDTGVILRVTPRVTKGRLVNLDIEQEVSAVKTTTTSGIDSPTIQQRRVKSTEAVPSGETVALGGLIKETKTNVDVGIPVLSKIPILGAPFGRTSVKTDRTELLVLITPRVIRNRDEARNATDALWCQIRAIIPEEVRLKIERAASEVR